MRVLVFLGGACANYSFGPEAPGAGYAFMMLANVAGTAGTVGDEAGGVFSVDRYGE